MKITTKGANPHSESMVKFYYDHEKTSTL